MAILGLFGGKKPPLRLVIDVGAHSIKALAFEPPSPRQKTPRVVKKMVARLPMSSEAASSSPFKAVTKLRELLFDLVKNLGAIPEQITIALGPSLAEHSFHHWTFRLDEDEKDVSRGNLSLSFYSLLAKHRDWKKMIVAYPLALTANGYFVKITEQPLGRIEDQSSYVNINNVQELPLDAEFGFQVLLLTLEETIGRILAGLKESLGGLPIEYVPLAATHTEGILQPLSLHDALLIDIGGAKTTLSCFKGGILRYVSVFPIAGRYFIKNIASASSASVDDAENAKKNYSKGLSSDIEAQRVRATLSESAETWEQSFLEALKNFYHVGPLPQKVLVFGGGAHIPEVVEKIRKGGWFKEFSHYESPEMQILEGQNLFLGDSLGGFLQGPEEVGFASLLIYSMHHEPLI